MLLGNSSADNFSLEFCATGLVIALHCLQRAVWRWRKDGDDFTSHLCSRSAVVCLALSCMFGDTLLCSSDLGGGLVFSSAATLLTDKRRKALDRGWYRKRMMVSLLLC